MGKLMQDQISDFKERGYCIIECVFNEATLDRCRALLDSFRSDHPDKWCLGSIIEVDEQLWHELAANLTLLEFAESVMGPFVQLDGLTIVGLPPSQDGRLPKVAGWHRDPWGQVPRCAAFERPLAINALSYLQDVTPEVGPLRVVEGSHRTPTVIPEADRRLPRIDEVALYLKAGDAVVVHNNLVHSGTNPQRIDVRRDMISIFYNLSWLKSTLRNEGVNAVRWKEKYRRDGNQRMLRLLGEDSQLTARNDTGFLEADEEAWNRWIAEERRRH